MRSALAVLALAGAAAAQGVTELITPDAPPPQGCGVTLNGKFQITIVNITQDASQGAAAAAPQQSSTSAASAPPPALFRRQDGGSASSFTPLECTLENGVLKDAKGRTGYIADNFQFQFDAPPQTGAIYTGGFSLCTNSSIALGGSAVWWQCLSGTFFNLYDRKWADHCVPCYFEAIGGAGKNVDLSAKPVFGTATAAAAGSSATAMSNSTMESNSTATSTAESTESTGSSSSSGSSGSGSSENSATTTAPPAGSDASKFIPSVLSVLSLAVVIAFQL